MVRFLRYRNNVNVDVNLPYVYERMIGIFKLLFGMVECIQNRFSPHADGLAVVVFLCIGKIDFTYVNLVGSI